MVLRQCFTEVSLAYLKKQHTVTWQYMLVHCNLNNPGTNRPQTSGLINEVAIFHRFIKYKNNWLRFCQGQNKVAIITRWPYEWGGSKVRFHCTVGQFQSHSNNKESSTIKLMKVKSDHRSKFSNLSNWKEEAWKKNQGFKGIWTRDLRDTGAMLYQLSYEATHWERGNVWLHSSVGRALHQYHGGHGFESCWSPDFFFQASSFQLLKLENLLRWSLFTFI